MPNGTSGEGTATAEWAAGVTLKDTSELERAVLGACLTDPDKVGELLKEPDGLFLRGEHRDIWDALKGLYLAGAPFDVFTVGDALRRNHKEYRDSNLTGMANEAMSLNFSADVELLREARIKRKALQVALSLAREVCDGHGTATEAAAKGMADLVELLRPTAGSTRRLWQIVDELIGRAEKGEVPDSIHTGFEALDAVLGDGLRRGQLCVVGARPSVGKSALLAQIALHAAKQGRKVLLFSPEMSGASLAARLIGGEVGLEPVRLRRAKMNTDWRGVRDQITSWPHLPFYLNDDSAITSGKIAAIAREHKARYGLDLLLVDYLQRLADPMGPNENRNLQLGRMVNTLATVARQLDCGLVLASQLSRAVEARADKRPTLADLRDSGEIEQSADVVLMLHRERNSEDAVLAVEKQREGPLDVLPMKFNPQSVKFFSVQKEV